jgi:hypothetical protein
VANNSGRAARNTSWLPKIAMLAKSGIVAIIKKPLATPFSTSIELIVLPVIGMMTSMTGIYSRGIFALPNIRLREFPCTFPTRMSRTTNGIAAASSATGLNHPGITLLSSM